MGYTKFNKNEIVFFLAGYYVDNSSRMFNKNGRELKGYKRNGYKTISTLINGKMYSVTLHRFIGLLKYGNRIYTENLLLRHLNGNKLDNSFNNICIGTHKNNTNDVPIKDRKRIGLNAASHRIKYPKELVEEIIKYHSECKSYKKTMLKYNISSGGTLHHILNYRVI